MENLFVPQTPPDRFFPQPERLWNLELHMTSLCYVR